MVTTRRMLALYMFLQSTKHGGPYQVLAVCKYAIVPTTIWKIVQKYLKLFLVIYLVTPPTFNVYKCYYLKLNLLILLESY